MAYVITQRKKQVIGNAYVVIGGAPMALPYSPRRENVQDQVFALDIEDQVNTLMVPDAVSKLEVAEELNTLNVKPDTDTLDVEAEEPI